MSISARLRRTLVPKRLRRRWHEAKLRRLALHLPAGSHLTADGTIMITSGYADHWERLERSYRFWKLRRRYRRLIRPIRPTTIRNRYRDLRSLHDRARHGIGRQDTWGLGTYLAGVAAHGLRRLAATGFILQPGTDPIDWVDTLDAHATALDAWRTQGEDKQGVVRLREAQAALRWLAHHLDALHVPPPHDRISTARRAARQRRAHGIADTDCADLGRYLSRIAALGMIEIADHGFGYPKSRYDGHEWHAELHRAAEDLQRWVRPPRGADSDDELHRILSEAKQGWRWIADNLNDLWD